jgi:hypothetical protein
MTSHDTLRALLGEWVRVSNPTNPASWTGKLLGLADNPSVLIESADGHRMSLPQTFTVERVDAPAAPADVPAPRSTVVHATPRKGSSLTPCCGRSPFNLPRTDRISIDPFEATCGEPDAPAPASLRDQIAAALYEWSCQPYRWADAHPDDLAAYRADADAVLRVPALRDMQERIADYENRITWETNCGSCARILDASIREHERAERAEAALDRVRAIAQDHLHDSDHGTDPCAAAILAALDQQEQAVECPPGVHSLFDPCPGDCSKPLNEPEEQQ